MFKRKIAILLSAAMIFNSVPVFAEDVSEETSILLTNELENSDEFTMTENAEEEVDQSEENNEAFSDDEEILEDDEIVSEVTDNDVDEFSGEDQEIVFDNSQDEEETERVEPQTADENFADTLAVMMENAEDEEAPWSSAENLPAGTYENVTANIYVPGNLNSVLGLTAYMTNPNDPFGSGGSNGKGQIGLPTTPVYQNATLVVGEDGKKTLTIDLVNNVFMLLAIGKGNGATVTDAVHAGKDMASNDYIDGPYDGRITKLTIELDNLSGKYTFNDCVEFGSALYQSKEEPDKDYKWYVPISLAVDLAPLTKESYTNVLTDENQGIGVRVISSNPDIMDAELKVEKITSGEEYEQVNKVITDACVNTPDFGYYNIQIEKDGKDVEVDSTDRISLIISPIAGSFWTNAYVCNIRDNSLKYVADGSITTEYGNLGEIWGSAGIVNGIKLGKLAIFNDEACGLKIQKDFSDLASGVTVTFYSSNDGKSCPNLVSLNTEVKFSVKRDNDDTDLKEKIIEYLKENSSDYKYINVDSLYKMKLWYGQNVSISGGNGKKTAMDIFFPDKSLMDGTGKVYYVNIARNTGTLTIQELQSGKDESGRVKTVAYTREEKGSKIVRSLYAGYENDATKLDGRGYYVVVSEGAVAEKPSAPVSVLSYNSSEQVVVPESDYYTIEGTPSAKLPGTYHVTVTLKDGYAWTDGTTDPVEFDWTIKALQTNKPVAVSGLTYNGSNQNGVKAGTGYNLAGTYTAKDAGSYNAKVLLAEGYEWSDGTTDPLTLTWSIAKKKVAKPSAVTNLVYNGKAQTGVNAGEGYTVSGNVQTKVGTYAAVATLDKNYAWSDGSTGAANVSWSIDKAAQKVNVKVASKSYKVTTVKKKAQSFTIGASASGKITYKVTGTPSKSAAKYLTVDKNGKVTVKKGAPAGTYTITVSAAATDTYKAADAKVTVKVTKVSQKVTAKVSSKTIKSKKIAKKNTSFSIGAKGKGKLTYKVTATPANAAKYISVNKNGKVTVKKKAPKGTYKITVTAAGNATYAGGSKTITVKVK